MSTRKDWAHDQARRVFDTVSQQGVSRSIAVNYIASELRTAHNRGEIAASVDKRRTGNGSAGDVTGAQTSDK